MADRVAVSPGVFTREIDNSAYLARGVQEIGVAIVGPTVKGPAFIPTVIEGSYNNFKSVFGGSNGKYYIPQTAKSYLKSAGRVTIVRVLGLGGYTVTSPIVVKGDGVTVSAVLAPAKALLSTAAISGSITGTAASSVLTVSSSVGSRTYNFSLDPTSPNYITNVLGTDPLGAKEFYVYSHFPEFNASVSASSVPTIKHSAFTSAPLDFTGLDYSYASTPWVRSQEVGGSAINLFRFHTLSDGDTANREIKIGVYNIRAAGETPGSTYGTFGLVIRAFGDTDRRPDILETYYNLSLDPASPNFVAKMVGDKYRSFDATGNILESGNFDNLSAYVRIDMTDDADTLSPELVPWGFAALEGPIAGGVTSTLPPVSYKTNNLSDSAVPSKKVFYGFNFAKKNNLQYLAPLPLGAVVGPNAAFSLTNSFINGTVTPLTLANTTEVDRKFIVGFQGGFDGMNPAQPKLSEGSIMATNMNGFDLSTATASGSVAFNKAINTLANSDEIDLNLIVVPGVNHRLHPSVTNAVLDLCEERADCFYILDGGTLDDSKELVANTTEDDDSSYAATYHPWMKVLDSDTNRYLWVPPSTLMAGVYAFSDAIGAKWYAPAGMDRGSITEAVDTRFRLSQSDRNFLYERSVNPIATFPGGGIVTWGQKTLQRKATALDRINVRRLLIALRKYISSASKYLVFEQNTIATRNRFLNLVNPYLESVQQRSGLAAFRVVMDDSNNTEDVIDRNILYGQIVIQPTKTAEFILLDFDIQRSGATFTEQ